MISTYCGFKKSIYYVNFDLTPYLEKASEEVLRKLLDSDFADEHLLWEIASSMAAGGCRALKDFFDHLDLIRDRLMKMEAEAHVDIQAARAWLTQHRPHLLQS